jgi:hypothetical protein
MPRLCSSCPYLLRAEGPVKGVVCTPVSHDRPGVTPACDLADNSDRLSVARAELRATIARRNTVSDHVRPEIWHRFADQAQALLDELEGGAECQTSPSR